MIILCGIDKQAKNLNTLITMPSPFEHAVSSAEKWGGTPEDYLPIHELIDSSKLAFPDARHRALTHNSWFITFILEKIFGPVITNTDGAKVPVRHIGERHVHEDYDDFMPSPQDFLARMTLEKWMQNGAKGSYPPSLQPPQLVQKPRKRTGIKYD